MVNKVITGVAILIIGLFFWLPEPMDKITNSSSSHNNGSENNKIVTATNLGDFEQDINSTQGASWTVSTDERVNGSSSATITRKSSLEDGHYLQIVGTIGRAFPYPWAGAYGSLTGDHEHGIDISKMSSINVKVKGTASKFRLLIFSTMQPKRPIELLFSVNNTWQKKSLSLQGIDERLFKSVSAISFSAGKDHDKFELLIDDVWLR